jgi:anti-sigma-K factor RskA
MSDQSKSTPEDLEAAAAEYALGVIDGAELQAARRRYETDPEFRAAVVDWQERLGGLAGEAGTREPPPSVLQAIMARVDTGPSALNAGRPSLWTSLAFWRGLAVAGMIASAVLAIALIKRDRLGPPLPPEAPAGLGPAYLASLDGKDGAAVFFAGVDPSRSGVFVFPSERARDLRGVANLWLARGDDDPRSLGAVSTAKPTYILLQPELAALLAGNVILVITLEGSVAAPTADAIGPVVAKGSLSPM